MRAVFLTRLIFAQVSFDTSCIRRLRLARTRFGLDGCVDIHHLIPRQFADRMPVDMLHSAENLVFMPTRAGFAQMNLHPARIAHDGGHVAYNVHVGKRLAGLAVDDREAIRRLQHELRAQIRMGDPALPWR